MIQEQTEGLYLTSPSGELFTNPFFLLATCFVVKPSPVSPELPIEGGGSAEVWISPDPARQFVSSYATGGNPINNVDPDGLREVGLCEDVEMGSKDWLAGDDIGRAGALSYMYSQIRENGFSQFLNFVESGELKSFTDDIETVDVGFIWKATPVTAFGRQVGTWGHGNFPEQAGFGPLRHQIGSFMVSAKYGRGLAEAVTWGNEGYGFLTVDVPNRIERSSPRDDTSHLSTNAPFISV